MISGIDKEVEYTEDILKTISIKDLNEYFRNYFKEENRIISIVAQDNIADLPTEEQIENLISKVSTKEIEPYQFEVKQVELIKEDLKGLKLLKEKDFQDQILPNLHWKMGRYIFKENKL